ncbi:MAG: FAD-binding oxidoreductase [Gammaproteobacteria bacterium]|nr:FAD-binding oxidoreductase [Gammaproteobacteria bacterium]MDH3749546.1 FAD-binding oxidoreductase [Gammaproteobacteria bacterium]MDH3804754.1 FAD-binding oxidoreductase [Gammaproteobacteria bacterium]
MAHCLTTYCGVRTRQLVSDIVTEIAAIVGEARLLTGNAVAERVTSFWNDAPMQGIALALPQTTEHVAAILRCCNARNQTVVTQGGLTNCVAAAEPGSSDVVLSLEKMNRIVEIDAVGSTAVVEAGAILQNVQEAVAAEGLRFPLDLGARGSCTIGGNIATNAGGINVLRYGMMRNLVLGLEAVLADGTVISSMNRMMKNNAGYDVKQLFIGTEGTLGVVTQAVLRLFPQPASQHCALVAIENFDSVTNFLLRLQQQMADSLSAFEIMWGDYYQAVTGEGGHRAPLSRDYPFYVVFEVEGSDSGSDARRFEGVLEQALADKLIVDAVIPKSAAESRDIWNIREEFDAVLEPEPVYLYDVSLPLRAMEDYVARVKANVAARWPDGQCYTFGHMADGNLHFFVAPNEQGNFHNESDKCVYEPLTAVGGSVSAEHGIGTDKMKWLSHSRSEAEIDLMRLLKQSLDPKNLLNPGRVLGVSL